jgi:RNA polymerase subunit RPABC4/transcription elongation factor Spt4
MAFCSNCGGKIEDGIKFCASCGKAVGGVSSEPVVSTVQQPAVLQSKTPMADEKYCFSCGSVIKKEAQICPKCGVNQSVFPLMQTTSNSGVSLFSLVVIIIGGILTLITLFQGLRPWSYQYFWWPLTVVAGGLELNRVYLRLYNLVFNIPVNIFFSLGIFLAIISMYKNKNKLALVLSFVSIGLLALPSVLMLILRIIIQIKTGR